MVRSLAGVVVLFVTQGQVVIRVVMVMNGGIANYLLLVVESLAMEEDTFVAQGHPVINAVVDRIARGTGLVSVLAGRVVSNLCTASCKSER